MSSHHFTRLLPVETSVVESVCPYLKMHHCNHRDSRDSLAPRHRTLSRLHHLQFARQQHPQQVATCSSTRCSRVSREVSPDHVQRLESECVERSQAAKSAREKHEQACPTATHLCWCRCKPCTTSENRTIHSARTMVREDSDGGFIGKTDSTNAECSLRQNGHGVCEKETDETTTTDQDAEKL